MDPPRVDDRLPEAVRWLGIGATVLEDTRSEGSAVEVRKGRDLVARHLLIPALCRLALEAACTETARRPLGKANATPMSRTSSRAAPGRRPYAALALFDGVGRAGGVMARLNRESREAADVFRILNEGAYGVEVGANVELIRQAEKLARWLQAANRIGDPWGCAVTPDR